MTKCHRVPLPARSSLDNLASLKEKVEVITKLGADHVVVEAEVDPVEAVEEITKGKMADTVLEFWVTTERCAQDWKMVRPWAGVYVPLGLGPLTSTVPYMTFADGVAERHILCGLNGTASEARELVNLFQAGRITLDYVKTLKVDQINDIFSMLYEQRLWSDLKAFRTGITVW